MPQNRRIAPIRKTIISTKIGWGRSLLLTFIESTTPKGVFADHLSTDQVSSAEFPFLHANKSPCLPRSGPSGILTVLRESFFIGPSPASIFLTQSIVRQ